LKISQQIKKASHIKFHENHSNGGRIISCGRTDKHNVAVGAFRNFADAPKL